MANGPGDDYYADQAERLAEQRREQEREEAADEIRDMDVTTNPVTDVIDEATGRDTSPDYGSGLVDESVESASEERFAPPGGSDRSNNGSSSRSDSSRTEANNESGSRSVQDPMERFSADGPSRGQLDEMATNRERAYADRLADEGRSRPNRDQLDEMTTASQGRYASRLADRGDGPVGLGEYDPDRQDPTTESARANLEELLGLGPTTQTDPTLARYENQLGGNPRVLDEGDVYTRDGEFGLSESGVEAVEAAAAERAAETDNPYGPWTVEDYRSRLTEDGSLSVALDEGAVERETIASIEEDTGVALDPSDVDVVEDEGAFRPELSEDAQRTLLVEQLRQENPEMEIVEDDVVFERSEGGVRAEITGVQGAGDEREGAIASRLQSASDWWQSGAETVGEGVESVIPSGELRAPIVPDPATGVPRVNVGTGSQGDEVVGGVTETVVGTVDPAGGVLFAGDAAGGIARGVVGWQDYRSEEARAAPSGREFLEDPVDVGADVADALVGAGYVAERGTEAAAGTREVASASGQAFEERPIETWYSGLAAGAASVAIPTGATRGARALSRLETRAPGSFARGLDDRGQMDLTITTGRTRSADDVSLRDRPADPTARTPEGRTPPREAFDSDEAYQRALQRREEEIARELLDEGDPLPDLDEMSPTDRVRALRDEFADEAEFRRELQRARETDVPAATTSRSDLRTPFGSPAGVESLEQGAFARGASLEREATAFGDGLLDQTLETQFGGTMTDSFQREAIVSDSLQREATTTTTTSEFGRAEATTTATIFGARGTGEQTLSPRFDGEDEGLEDAFGGGVVDDEDVWQTGFAQPEDILEESFGFGDNDEEGWF